MKTKLLRKIRKRYVITRYDKLYYNACNRLLETEKEIGLPFYEVEDTGCPYTGSTVHKTIEGGLDRILKLIKRDYGNKFDHSNRNVKKKVWYIK